MLALEQDKTDDTPNGRILIVDDDPDFAAGLSTFLRVQGYEVETAESENEALATIATFEADVAILDYRLGATIGVDLVQPLTRRRPNLICLMATAYSDLDTAVKAMRHRITDYFCKPLNTDELLAALDRCFELHRLRRQREVAERALREAKKLEAVAQLAAGVAHNSNSLLMVILGNAERLKLEMAKDPAALALIDSIQEKVAEAADLNWNLLTFTRQQILRSRPCDLSRLVEEALAAKGGDGSSAETIDIDLEKDLWPVFADPDQLRSAIGHLLQNALDALPQAGRITITARNLSREAARTVATCQLTPRDYVMLSVSDTGHGMPPAVAERALDPFFSRRGMHEKAGLGLSIVSGFASQSGGNIELDTTEGAGTTVRLYLPRVTDETR